MVCVLVVVVHIRDVRQVAQRNTLQRGRNEGPNRITVNREAGMVKMRQANGLDKWITGNPKSMNLVRLNET